MNFKKGIGPVVATALLLVVAVVAVVGFQGWFSSYSSSMFSDVEIKSNSADSNDLRIDTLIDGILYVINNIEDNLSINKLEIGGVECLLNTNLSLGMNNLSVSDCVGSITTSTPDIVLITKDSVLEKQVYLKDNLVSSSGSDLVVTNTFITVWNTSITGLSNSNQIILPLRDSGTYNFIVYWDDGTNDTITYWNQSEITHTYGVEGIKKINITGTIDGFGFNITKDYYNNTNDDGDKLLDIIQWGPLKLGNGGGYFLGAENFDISATDYLNLSGTTNFSMMFLYSNSFNADINYWDTSGVIDMSYMFANSNSFNQPLNFDTSGVTNMNYMFSSANSFNQPLNLDTGNVISMDGMFIGANSFNQPLNFNTSKVITMSFMFALSSFNQPLNFDTSNVTDMNSMFFQTIFFNQSLNFNTSKVIDMSAMFRYTLSFNQPLNFDTSKVTDMSFMFSFADSFNQTLNFNTGNVTNMNGMFANSNSFNKPLNFDTSKVTDMNNMFYGADIFNQPLNFNTSEVTTMVAMFSGAVSFNQNLTSWSVSLICSEPTAFAASSPLDSNGMKPNWGVGGSCHT